MDIVSLGILAANTNMAELKEDFCLCNVEYKDMTTFSLLEWYEKRPQCHESNKGCILPHGLGNHQWILPLSKHSPFNEEFTFLGKVVKL